MYFIDVQGTLIDDINKLPIKGAIEFIDYLNTQKIPYIIITNNTKYESMEFLKMLNKLGFDIPKENYLDPFFILNEVVTTKNIAPFGNKEFLEILKNRGFVFNYKNPENILVGIDKNYTNEDYSLMIELSLKSEKLIGINETSIYNKNGQKYPGVGAILHMIKYATGANYDIIGKPSVKFYSYGKNMLNCSFDEITIISDDVIGDLIGAKKLGMKTIFVTSGKIKDENEVIPRIEKKYRPDGIFKDISEVYKRICND